MSEGCIVAAFSWIWSERIYGMWSQEIATGNGLRKLTWLVGARSVPQRLFFFCVYSRTGSAEVLAVLLLAPKVVKTLKKNRVSKGGKAGVEINIDNMTQRHILGPSKKRTIIQSKAQQSSLLMEKLQASGSTAGDVGLQIPEMFKQPLRVQTAAPLQVFDKEGTTGSKAFIHDGNGIVGTTGMDEAVHIQDGAGMTLLIGNPRISDQSPPRGLK
ncbi:hypothetical protein NDU88_004658 [Pleurodeles waltl]|uniref:Uncharacterized protein n=1 Tax=Pleurodeles waltl TaxID=8319 RepID=A0AAV7MU34_PLEWA|nr:hypothetical protein NDU88_004658 [Pleurodeles waltl]